MVRVRQLLSTLNGVEVAQLKKLLPRGVCTVPDEPDGVRYPSAIVNSLSKGDDRSPYSILGCVTEDLLRVPPIQVTPEFLTEIILKYVPDLPPAALKKITTSKTTDIYLTHIRETRQKLRVAAIGEMEYDTVVSAGSVEGHPDIRTATQIFEVKMTGRMKQSWVDFIFQVFCYAALDPTATDVYLVLPLQEMVWHHDVRGWAKRADFAAFLEAAAVKKSANTGAVQTLLAEHRIGSHMPKLRSLVDTIHSFPADRPAQIFLAGPQSSQLRIADEELDAAGSAVVTVGAQYFIHSPYIINLCSPAGADDDYHTRLLVKNLEYGARAGARGVVVHVGKYVKQDIADAMEHMRTNIRTALEAASPECPILLETPAGQGTEVLRTWDEFAAFVAEINDPRLRVCVDTCHVFACGEDPVTYVSRFIDEHPNFVRLIHFNDSATPCGSCVDRHAFVGEGHIGLEKMTEIACVASANDLPMVIE